MNAERKGERARCTQEGPPLPPQQCHTRQKYRCQDEHEQRRSAVRQPGQCEEQRCDEPRDGVLDPAATHDHRGCEQSDRSGESAELVMPVESADDLE